MDLIDYSADTNVLLSVRGHPYDRNAFMAMFEQMSEFCVTAVEQPATGLVLQSAGVEDFDALVFYDMPGLDFHHRPPLLVEPTVALKERFIELTRRGVGMVFLHHAIAGWPEWYEYGDIMGGRFNYRPTSLRGRAVSDSGYRHAVDYNVQVLREHPVTAGLPASFPVTDELYYYEVFENAVTPLLASDFDFDPGNFKSAHAATGDGATEADWQPGRASNLVGWVKRYNNSPVVYLQMGDAPAIFANPHYRKLLANAIGWVASEPARAWARSGGH